MEPGTAVVATVEDYEVAYKHGAEVLGATLSDVKKPARELLGSLQQLAVELAQERDLPPERVAVTRRELRERTGLPDLQAWRLLNELVRLEHVEVVSGSRGRRCYYRPYVVQTEKSCVLNGLLHPDELRRRLGTRT
jgi:hypothetical protein